MVILASDQKFLDTGPFFFVHELHHGDSRMWRSRSVGFFRDPQQWDPLGPILFPYHSHFRIQQKMKRIVWVPRKTIAAVDSCNIDPLDGLKSMIHGLMVQIICLNCVLGGGNSNIFYFHLYLGKIFILTSIFFKWVDTTN